MALIAELRVANFTVEDDAAIGDGEDGSVRVFWTELEQVRVVTVQDAPWAEDVLYVLVDLEGNACVVPEGSSPSLTARLFELPGFEPAEFQRAMRSPDFTQLLCWRRDAA
jgi:hypothetical protein